jgi:hypothetical protein
MAAMICFNMGWQHMSILSQTIASMNYFDYSYVFPPENVMLLYVKHTYTCMFY